MPAKYRITPDIYTFAIEERRVAGEKSKSVPPGTERWVPVEWPGNLEQTAQRLLHLLTVSKAAERHINDTQQLIGAVYEARNDVREIVREALNA